MFHIIVNPQGGKGKSLKALDEVVAILEKHQRPYIVHKTERPAHATEIAKQISHTADCDILMLGGDGSYNEVLNGIENFDNAFIQDASSAKEEFIPDFNNGMEYEF